MHTDFLKPPLEYGIYPIVHEGILHHSQLKEMILECGFAGAVCNIAYGSGYPDDEGEWQRLADNCRDLFSSGLRVWLYDEKGYPSGTAGGVVLERCPELEGTELMCFSYWKTLTGPAPYRADTPSGQLFKALLVPLTEGEAVDITDTVDKNGTLRFEIPSGVYRLAVFLIRRLFDSTHAAHSYSEPRRYIDVFNPEAAKAFVAVTHEKYKQVLGSEFGQGVKAFFTDEPSLIGWNIPQASYARVTWSSRLPALFEERYGYPIESALVAVFFGKGEDVVKKRCDFWELTADLLADSFFGVLQDWCEENHTKLSGHMLCEENLLEHISCYGSYYRSAKRLHYPGIDQLESDPSKLMNREQLPIARLAASFCDVYGSGESFTEASDHTSRHHNLQIPIEWVRASVNWHMALGVNNMTSYYNFDYFTAAQMRSLNTYTARLGTLLRVGTRESRVAVLYPEYSMWALFKPTENAYNQGQSADALRLQQTMAGASWELLNRQIDFDYIDEAELCDGDTAPGVLAVRERRYECLILPHMHVMKRESVYALCRFMDAGGGVIALDCLPEVARETGRKDDFLQILAPYMTKWGPLRLVPMEQFSDAAEVLPRTVHLLPYSVESQLYGFAGSLSSQSSEILSPNLLAHIRRDGAQRIIFLCNMGGSSYDGSLITQCEPEVRMADPETGLFTNVSPEQTDSGYALPVHLKSYESCFYIVTVRE